MSMFRALSPRTIGVRLGFAETVALAARQGWQGLDLPMLDLLELAAASSPAALAEQLAGAGLRPAGWGLPFNWRAGVTQQDLEQLDACAALAAQLGCLRAYTWVMPASDERPFRENFAHHLALLRPVVQTLAAHGCCLGLEFVGPRHMRVERRYGFISSLDGMLCLAQALGEHVGLLLDSYHWYTTLGTTSDIRALQADEVVYVHLNDAPAGVAVADQLDNVRGLPGATGVIDLVGFLTALRETGYAGPVAPEPFERALADLPPEQASQSTHEQLLGVWERAGLEARGEGLGARN